MVGLRTCLAKLQAIISLINIALRIFQTLLGMYKEAVESLKQALRIKPDYNIDAYNNLGNAYDNLGMYKEAAEAYRQAIRIDPDDADTHYKLGIAYVSLNDRGSAVEQYEILKTLDSELANKLFKLINK